MSTMSPATFVPAPCGVPALSDDGELLLRSARDDGEAFGALFERHRDSLQGFLYRKLRSHEDAEDAVTLTFCNAWRARGSFRGSSGKAWLYQIATRVALDMLRSRGRRVPEQEWDPRLPEQLCESATEGSSAGDPMDEIIQAETVKLTRSAVGQSMQRLASEERRLVELFYFDGHNYDEISTMLGISRSQVRGRLHRIRGRVRQDLVARQQWRVA